MNPLERYREAEDLTLEELGKRLGAKKNSVWGWCNDKCLPTGRFRSRIAPATNGKVTYAKLAAYWEKREAAAPKRKAA